MIAQRKRKSDNKSKSRKRKREAADNKTKNEQTEDGQIEDGKDGKTEDVPTRGARNTFHRAPIKYAYLKHLWDQAQPIRSGSHITVRSLSLIPSPLPS